MTRPLTIFNQDDDGLFEALPQNISAEVHRVKIGKVQTDFYKLVAFNGKYSFLVGIFDDKETATKNLMDLHKVLKKAMKGKIDFDGWSPTAGDVSALDLLEELEFTERRFAKGGDDDDEVPFY